MQPINILSKSLAALLLLSGAIAAAAPAVDHTDPLPNLGIFIRAPDGSYVHSPAAVMAYKDRLRASGELGSLAKRSYANVQSCATQNCQSCHQVFSGSFSKNSGCISAANTACLIISDLSDANVEFWNHSGCNGNNSDYGTCGQATANVGAPGTNSIGVHTGCK